MVTYRHYWTEPVENILGTDTNTTILDTLEAKIRECERLRQMISTLV